VNIHQGLKRVWIVFSIIAALGTIASYQDRLKAAFALPQPITFVFPEQKNKEMLNKLGYKKPTKLVTLDNGFRFRVAAASLEHVLKIEQSILDETATLISDPEFKAGTIYFGIVSKSSSVSFPFETRREVAVKAIRREFEPQLSLSSKANVLGSVFSEVAFWVLSPLVLYLTALWVWRGFRKEG
jgi:hypothetical protein